MSTEETKMKPTEPTESNPLEQLHEVLLDDDKWTMPEQSANAVQPQVPATPLPPTPEIPEDLPTEPAVEDVATAPEAPQPPVEHVPEVPEVASPETPVEEAVAAPIQPEKKPHKFGKKTAGILAVTCLLLVGGGVTYAIFGRPVENKPTATTETSSTPTPTDASDETDQTDVIAVEPTAPAPTAPTPTTAPKPTSEGSTGSTPATPAPAAPTAKTYGISYTNDCYTPANITIKRGDSIKFTNNSTRDMWPASDSHPSHTVYPEFDSRQDIAPGGTYIFTFSKSGPWAYHDHSKPNCSGTITVQ